MAINPPTNSSGDPCRVEGEYFVMKRKNMDFEFKVDKGSTYSGKGYIILTTVRIIAVNTKLSVFKAFDLPFHLIANIEFKQPIFGANYIGGDCDPLMESLPGKIHFKLWFMEGGCGTFVPICFKMREQTRRDKQIEAKMLNALKQGTFNKTAYIDPNDPSIIFLEQPSIQSGDYHPGLPIQQPPQQMQQNNCNQFGGNHQFNQPLNHPQGGQYNQMSQNPLPNQSNYTNQSSYGNGPQINQMSQNPYAPIQPNYNTQPFYVNQPQPNLINQNPFVQPQMQQSQISQPNPVPPMQNQQPSQENLYPEAPTAYPQSNINVLSNTNIQNPTQEQKAKYFGFWGPELGKNN